LESKIKSALIRGTAAIRLEWRGDGKREQEDLGRGRGMQKERDSRGVLTVARE